MAALASASLQARREVIVDELLQLGQPNGVKHLEDARVLALAARRGGVLVQHQPQPDRQIVPPEDARLDY
eukprot:scaffold21502_cov63-Phaeocystis_antarctica.AAC.3